ncbi:hypothetical protein EIP91_011932 [Steccherinum ochraceum]|uniref:Uncharacterized protein n=1 Tax=Steccherinum ochraceum TaxID=92696 RepID=A0A4R0RXP2_9APHY|nr:hypothetical protein EIP91_011932 [Steccherinum ochraceum]
MAYLNTEWTSARCRISQCDVENSRSHRELDHIEAASSLNSHLASSQPFLASFHYHPAIDLRSRIWILRKIFQRPHAPGVSQEDLGERFQETESDRGRTFERTRRQQQFEFASAAAHWTKAEDARDDAFQEFLADSLAAFVASQALRAQELLEQLESHERTFSAGDKMRQSAFRNASDARLGVFKEQQEERQKEVDKFSSYQDDLHAKRRDERCRAYRKIVKGFRIEFERMLEGAEGAFKVAQQEREKRILTCPSRDSTSSIAEGFTSPTDPLPTTLPPPPTIPVDPPLLSTARTAVPGTRHQQPPSFDFAPFQFAATRSASSPRRQIVSPPLDSSHPVTTAAVDAAMPSAPIPQPEALDHAPDLGPAANSLSELTLDKMFAEAESGRQDLFSRDEEHRNILFSQTLSYIKQSGNRRRAQFEALKTHLEKQFEDTQKHQDQRDLEFDAFHATMHRSFEGRLFLMEERTERAEAVQAEHAERCFQAVNTLISGMDGIITETKRTLTACFTRSLPAPSTPTEFIRRPHLCSLSEEPIHYFSDLERPSAPTMPFGSSATPASLPFSSQQPKVFGSSSGASADPFSPQLLLQTNLFTRELPVPPPPGDELLLGSDSNPAFDAPRTTETDLAAKSTVVYVRSLTQQYASTFLDHASRFTSAQTCRQVASTTQLHRFNHEIAGADLQAQQTFTSQQHIYQQSLTTMSFAHTERVFKLVHDADECFASEGFSRRVTFKAHEVQRQTQFDKALHKFHEAFGGKYRELMKGVAEKEAKRTEEFQVWQEKIVSEWKRKMKEWTEGFEADEREREKSVEELMKA